MWTTGTVAWIAAAALLAALALPAAAQGPPPPGGPGAPGPAAPGAPPGPGPAAEPVKPPAPASGLSLPTPSLPTWDQLNEASRQFWQRTWDNTTQAIDTTRRLATGTVVRETRPCRAPDGTTNCEAVAKQICAAKGYADGRPLDTVSKETCPTPVRLGLRKAEPGECRIDHSIAAASCW